jgi:hypothetical protein
MGIKEWLTPQISEHWPKNTPLRFKIKETWLRRPGRTSDLTPKEGIVQEWITSSDEKNPRTLIEKGKTNKSLENNKRNPKEEFSKNLPTSLILSPENS